MILKQDIPWTLLEKYFSKKANKLENLRVIRWKKMNEENSIIFEQLENYYKETGNLPVDFSPNATKAFEKVSLIIRKDSEPSLKLKLFPVLLKIAAAILIFIGSWWLFYQYNVKQKETVFATIITNDSIRKEITLPDSSHVWLNSGSSIRFPEKFESVREVVLTGEAYFEIAHDTVHPFIVHAGKTKTKVLGTKFNLHSYTLDKHVVLNLTQGKVIFSADENGEVLLTAGQKATFDNSSHEISKSENNNPNFLSWKTHEFYFDNLSLDAVFKTLADVYQFKYQFEIERIKNRKLTASFKKRPIEEIIKTIAVSSGLSISMQNGVYFIK